MREHDSYTFVEIQTENNNRSIRKLNRHEIVSWNHFLNPIGESEDVHEDWRQVSYDSLGPSEQFQIGLALDGSAEVELKDLPGDEKLLID